MSWLSKRRKLYKEFEWGCVPLVMYGAFGTSPIKRENFIIILIGESLEHRTCLPECGSIFEIEAMSKNNLINDIDYN